MGLSACGGGGAGSNDVLGFFSTGQVKTQTGSNTVGIYAASRFAEQVSFGTTPALVEEIRQKGFEKWIDDQFKLPVSQIDTTPFLGYVDPVPQYLNTLYQKTYPNFVLSAPDQLRSRLAWSLSQFIVVSDRKTNQEALLFWANLLQKYGDGNYADLLYQVSVSPAMGHYLDNQQNRPKSAECSYCAPNENYARELMQLFTLGVIKLNQDGTYVKNAKGAVVETYTQKDVEELARVLTGWNFDPEPRIRGDRNWGNWGKPMVPSTWPPERDAGQKSMFGQVFPAGQTQVQDLRMAISMLMSHQNIAPFVSTRLIQHFVKSNPTPAYVSRVADKFKNNGAGVAGDMKAVVKAILLDPEARAGDSPLTIRKDDGKLREPFLHATSVWRGLGCKSFPEYDGGWIRTPELQRPLSAESVFSYYAPTDRAPGSGLLSPEQKLINSSELTTRFRMTTDARQGDSLRLMTTAGCDINALISAYSTSPSAFNDFLSARYFRGAMPPTLRSNIEQLIRNPQWNTANVSEGALRMLDYAIGKPLLWSDQMINRRQLLASTGAVTASGLLGGLSFPGIAAGDDYKALVVIHLNGGSDANNALIPTDGAYLDYQSARQNLAIPKKSLVNLAGTSIGHSFGVHSSLADIAPLYDQKRLAFISNVGPLVEPTTAEKVLAGTAKVPPFLLSHNDQTSMVQGWSINAGNDSGWGGRGLEMLPASLRNPIAAVTMDTSRTLVLGTQSPISFMPPGGSRYWGTADLAFPASEASQSLNRMANWQFAGDYEAEYARTMGNAIADQTRFVRAFQKAVAPSADFGTDDIGNKLRSLASVLPIFKSQGLKRQVFLIHWGGFDTHSNQRGTGPNTQDTQFIALAKALAAFDETNKANGMDMNVVSVVMSEFGRTLRPGSGGGSEHAWGSHWLAMGGPVAGGNVVGSFPNLVLGGVDDGDPGKNGRFVPTTSSDQVGATLLQWLGLSSTNFLDVFPDLTNFQNKTIPLFRS